MNPAYLGDSYDIVKPFFCEIARSQGYAVYLDPMYTGDWTPAQSSSFLRFIGARPFESRDPKSLAALFIDPDIGIRDRPSRKHITFGAIEVRCRQFPLVIVFDQSFSRGPAVRNDLVRKLSSLRTLGVRGV